MSGIDTSREFIPVTIAVLTISDTRTLAEDKSGELLVARLGAAGHQLAARALVRDDVAEITDQLGQFIADQAIDCVIATGGTGLTGRDVTPKRFGQYLKKKLKALAKCSDFYLFRKSAPPPCKAVQLQVLRGAPIFLRCLVRPLPAGMRGMICWRINSITGIAHVILSRLCRVCAKLGWRAAGQGNRLVTMFIAR